MGKSKLFARIIAGEPIEALYKAGAVVINKRANFVEYVYCYDWDERIRAAHPEFPDYVVRCIGINARGIPFRGSIPFDDGRFFFRCTDDEKTARTALDNPAVLYDADFTKAAVLHL